jgi:hypothetical protein
MSRFKQPLLADEFRSCWRVAAAATLRTRPDQPRQVVSVADTNGSDSNSGNADDSEAASGARPVFTLVSLMHATPIVVPVACVGATNDAALMDDARVAAAAREAVHTLCGGGAGSLFSDDDFSLVRVDRNGAIAPLLGCSDAQVDGIAAHAVSGVRNIAADLVVVALPTLEFTGEAMDASACARVIPLLLAPAFALVNSPARLSVLERLLSLGDSAASAGSHAGTALQTTQSSTSESNSESSNAASSDSRAAVAQSVKALLARLPIPLADFRRLQTDAVPLLSSFESRSASKQMTTTTAVNAAAIVRAVAEATAQADTTSAASSASQAPLPLSRVLRALEAWLDFGVAKSMPSSSFLTDTVPLPLRKTQTLAGAEWRSHFLASGGVRALGACVAHCLDVASCHPSLDIRGGGADSAMSDLARALSLFNRFALGVLTHAPDAASSSSPVSSAASASASSASASPLTALQNALRPLLHLCAPELALARASASPSAAAAAALATLSALTSSASLSDESSLSPPLSPVCLITLADLFGARSPIALTARLCALLRALGGRVLAAGAVHSDESALLPSASAGAFDLMERAIDALTVAVAWRPDLFARIVAGSTGSSYVAENGIRNSSRSHHIGTHAADSKRLSSPSATGSEQDEGLGSAIIPLLLLRAPTAALRRSFANRFGLMSRCAELAAAATAATVSSGSESHASVSASAVASAASASIFAASTDSVSIAAAVSAAPIIAAQSGADSPSSSSSSLKVQSSSRAPAFPPPRHFLLASLRASLADAVAIAAQSGGRADAFFALLRAIGLDEGRSVFGWPKLGDDGAAGAAATKSAAAADRKQGSAGASVAANAAVAGKSISAVPAFPASSTMIPFVFSTDAAAASTGMPFSFPAFPTGSASAAATATATATVTSASGIEGSSAISSAPAASSTSSFSFSSSSSPSSSLFSNVVLPPLSFGSSSASFSFQTGASPNATGPTFSSTSASQSSSTSSFSFATQATPFSFAMTPPASSSSSSSPSAAAALQTPTLAPSFSFASALPSLASPSASASAATLTPSLKGTGEKLDQISSTAAAATISANPFAFSFSPSNATAAPASTFSSSSSSSASSASSLTVLPSAPATPFTFSFAPSPTPATSTLASSAASLAPVPVLASTPPVVPAAAAAVVAAAVAAASEAAGLETMSGEQHHQSASTRQRRHRRPTAETRAAFRDLAALVQVSLHAHDSIAV